MSLISEICVGERATVDAADPWTLKRVKLLGKTSGNKRTYPIKVQEAAVSQFNNRKIYVDHGDLDSRKPLNRKRSYAERLGIVVANSVSVDAVTESTYGDVRLNPKHPLAEMVKSDYENETPGVGFSIAAECDFPNGGNIGECLAIKRIFSVDLVDDPATTISLTEAMATESEYEKGKDHGEMTSRLDAHENRLAEHAKRHEEHHARLDGHDGEHRLHHEHHADHEGRMRHLETSLEECNREYEAMGGNDHIKAVEQWRNEIEEAKRLTAESQKISEQAKAAIAKAEATSKIVPRAPNAGNPLEVRPNIPTPITNGVGLQKPNFARTKDH